MGKRVANEVLDASQLICEPDHHCTCVADVLDEYTCNCRAFNPNALSSVCRSCGAVMVRINTDTGKRLEIA